MFDRKTVLAGLIVTLALTSLGLCQTLEENWNDFLHYTKIGRFDLASGYAQAVIDSNPDPVELLTLSETNVQGYSILLQVQDNKPNPELAKLTDQLMAVIEEGRYQRRSTPKIISEEIRRLSSTARGKYAAAQRLKNAGEYAIVYMLDAMADETRKEELPNIIWALPQVGKDAIRPLTAALQSDNIAVKAEIIKALGKIGYPQSLAYLKYVSEKDESSELRQLAEESINEIDPDAMKLPAAQLFYRLSEHYYDHSESLAPIEESQTGNIWLWDQQEKRLMMHSVDRKYFYELMAMRECENALKADSSFGMAIGLWVGSFFKAEATGLKMPDYFGEGHADAMTYATTAGPEYIHQALARAIKDEDAHVALSCVESLATVAGEKSLLFRMGIDQPLVRALRFNDRAVKFSAAIAIAAAGPQSQFPESPLVTENLAAALSTNPDVNVVAGLWDASMADKYAVRSAKVMLNLAQTRNTIIDLKLASEALKGATSDSRTEIQKLAGQILAYFDTADAQKSIADMGLNEKNGMDVRIEAFNSLALSAKINANKLDDGTIDAIYNIISSKDSDPQLRAVAASAFGALDLPSDKVKRLLLDQAKS